MDDDEVRKVKAAITLGEDLSDISVGELNERIAVLKQEIERYEAAIVTKDAARLAADAVFGKPKTE